MLVNVITDDKKHHLTNLLIREAVMFCVDVSCHESWLIFFTNQIKHVGGWESCWRCGCIFCIIPRLYIVGLGTWCFPIELWQNYFFFVLSSYGVVITSSFVLISNLIMLQGDYYVLIISKLQKLWILVTHKIFRLRF